MLGIDIFLNLNNQSRKSHHTKINRAKFKGEFQILLMNYLIINRVPDLMQINLSRIKIWKMLIDFIFKFIILI